MCGTQNVPAVALIGSPVFSLPLDRRSPRTQEHESEVGVRESHLWAERRAGASQPIFAGRVSRINRKRRRTEPDATYPLYRRVPSASAALPFVRPRWGAHCAGIFGARAQVWLRRSGRAGKSAPSAGRVVSTRRNTYVRFPAASYSWVGWRPPGSPPSRSARRVPTLPERHAEALPEFQVLRRRTAARGSQPGVLARRREAHGGQHPRAVLPQGAPCTARRSRRRS